MLEVQVKQTILTDIKHKEQVNTGVYVKNHLNVIINDKESLFCIMVH